MSNSPKKMNTLSTTKNSSNKRNIMKTEKEILNELEQIANQNKSQ